MDQQEIDILLNAFNSFLEEKADSTEGLDVLENKLSGLLEHVEENKTPPAYTNAPDNPFESFQDSKASHAQPAVQQESIDPFNSTAQTPPSGQVTSSVPVQEAQQKASQLQVELDLLTEELARKKNELASLKYKARLYEEQAESVTKMTEMSMKFMLDEVEQVKSTAAVWEQIRQAIAQFSFQQYRAIDRLLAWYPKSFSFTTAQQEDNQPLQLFVEESLGMKYIVAFQLPTQLPEYMLASLLIKQKLEQIVKVRRYCAASLVLQELDAFYQQIKEAFRQDGSGWNCACVIIDENMHELEFTSSYFPLMEQQGRAFKVFDGLVNSIDGKKKYTVRRMKVKPGTTLFLPSFKELPEHFADWLIKVGQDQSPQQYHEELEVWKDHQDLTVLMLKLTERA